MNNEYKYSRDEIVEKIYEEELSINELLSIKNQMKAFNFDEDDFKYVDEMIEDCFDVMELSQLKEIRNYVIELNIDTIIVDKYIKRKSPLTNELIETMEPDDIAYIVNEGGLTVEQMLFIKKLCKNIKIDSDVLTYLDESINDEISDLDSEDDIIDTKRMFDKYGITNAKLNRKLRNVSVDDGETAGTIEKRKNNDSSLSGEILVSNLAEHLFLFSALNNDSSSTKEEIDNNYELYQYEEEELEEDDYYYEDLD
ncbi:MAG: hypothetical protein ACI4XM_07940 [Candidatus Coprovivens sp.]